MDAKKEPRTTNISYLHSDQNHSNSVPLPYFTQQLEKRKLVTVRLNCISLSLSLPRAIRRGEIFGWAQIMARHITPFCKRGGPWKERSYNATLSPLSLSLFLFCSPRRCHVGAPGNVVNELSRVWSSRIDALEKMTSFAPLHWLWLSSSFLGKWLQE